MKNLSAKLLTTAILAAVAPAAATTLQVDPVNANGTTIFASLNAASQYLKTNGLDVDGTPDTVNVMVDSLGVSNDGVFYYTGTDDLTVDGDGDGNGTWCTVAVGTNNTSDGTFKPAEDAFFKVEQDGAVAWTASVVIRNFILMPEFVSAGATQVATSGAGIRTAFSAAMGGNAGTAGSILLENVVLTASLPGNVAADPFTNNHATGTRWYRGLHTGSKSTDPAQLQTDIQFRNVIVSGVTNDSVTWFGDNFDARFGPGFVIAHTIAQNPINIVNSAFDNKFYIVGEPNNRNLMYMTGDATGDRLINLDVPASGIPTGSEITEFSYTDVIGGMARQKMRLAGPLRLVDNSIFAFAGGAGAGNIEGVHAAAATDLVITDSTFFNTADNTTARHINHGFVNSMTVTNTIFAAGPGEADLSPGTTDVAFDVPNFTASYTLFPESGPYRLRPGYDSQFPPSPIYDANYINPNQPTGSSTIEPNSSNADPAFLADTMGDYPLPANLAAWQTAKITLAGSNFLKPGNPALLTLGPAGAPLFGAHTSYASTAVSDWMNY